MAARKSHRYLTAGETMNAAAEEDQLELEEADVVWSTNDVIIRDVHTRPAGKPAQRRSGDSPLGPKSAVPLNIPEWSKIEMEDDEGNDKTPPHEYLARVRGASLSVHQGVGRTLKGRDLSRVRNAIWKQIGFED